MAIRQTLRNLTAKEKFTFKIHLTYSIMQGVIVGAFVLNEFIFISDMQGSKLKLSILLQFAVIVLLLSVPVNEIMQRVKFPRKMLKIFALSTHLPLFGFLFFPHNILEYTQIHHYLFLGIFLFYYLNDILVIPTLNQLLKETYEHQNFGKLYSYASSINKVVILMVTFTFGIILDYNNFAFTYIYPFLAVLGITSVFLLTRIQPKIRHQEIARPKLSKSLLLSFKQSFIILKTNRPFLFFQIGFMLYGMAWMLTAAVITIYFKEVFHMNHLNFGFYKNVFYNILAIILLPFFGKLIGKIDPRKFGVITFASFLVFLFLLAIAENFTTHYDVFGIQIYPILIVAYLFYSVFAATMALLWYIGSVYFCPKNEVNQYQSVHLALTGVRGIIGFQLGYFSLQLLGFQFTFMISVGFLALAILVLIWSQKTQKLHIQEN